MKDKSLNNTGVIHTATQQLLLTFAYQTKPNKINLSIYSTAEPRG